MLTASVMGSAVVLLSATVINIALPALACGLAPNVEWLIASRERQGLAAAVLTPQSLAVIQGT